MLANAHCKHLIACSAYGASLRFIASAISPELSRRLPDCGFSAPDSQVYMVAWPHSYFRPEGSYKTTATKASSLSNGRTFFTSLRQLRCPAYCPFTLIRFISSSAEARDQSAENLQEFADSSDRSDESAPPAYIEEQSEAVPSQEKSNQLVAPLASLFSALYRHSKRGDIYRATRLLREIQDWAEKIEQGMCQSPTGGIHLYGCELEADLVPDLEPIKDLLGDTHLVIRIIALASFLDMITEAEAFNLAEELFEPTHNHSPLISEELYPDPYMKAALLRYAAASSNEALLNSLMYPITIPIPEEIMRAQLESHVRQYNWTGLKKLLQFIRMRPDISWNAEFAMSLAGAILRLSKDLAENGGTETEIDAFTIRPKAFLFRLLRGVYGKPDSGRLSDDTSQYEYLQCIGHIIQHVLPGIAGEGWPDVTQLRRIPVRAFNTLLRAVVETRGSLEGRRMWRIFCTGILAWEAKQDTTALSVATLKYQVSRSANAGPDTSRDPSYRSVGYPWPQTRQETNERAVPLVTPNMISLQILTHGALREYKALMLESSEKSSQEQASNSSQTDPTPTEVDNENSSNSTTSRFPASRQDLEDLFAWSVEMYQDFGLTMDEITEVMQLQYADIG